MWARFSEKFLGPAALVLARWLCRFFLRVEVQGDLLPLKAKGGLLLIANHCSYLDGVILRLFLSPDLLFTVDTQVAQRPFFKWVVKQVRRVEIESQNPFALRGLAKTITESEEKVVFFPEGRLSVHGSLMKVYPGAAFLAMRSQAPILPVHISGTYFFIWGSHRYGKRHLFPKTTITVGSPLKISVQGSGRIAREAVRTKIVEAMQDIAFKTFSKKTIPAHLMNAARQEGWGKKVFSDPIAGELSWRRFWALVGLLQKGFEASGDCVAVLLPTGVAAFASAVALQGQKKLPAFLNPAAGKTALQDQIVLSGAKTLITARPFLQAMKLEENFFSVPVLYIEDILRGASPWSRLQALLGFFRTAMTSASGDPKSGALVFFTSGTEGKPKGVLLSHEALSANVAQIRSVIDVRPSDVFFSSLPLFHAFGFTAGALVPLYSGSKVAFALSPLQRRKVAEGAYWKNATVLFGTDTFLRQWGKAADPLDFDELRVVVSGAERLTEETKSLWGGHFGQRLHEGYGLTETSPVLALNTRMFFREGSVGKPLPGVEIVFHPLEGLEKGGEMFLKAPNLMEGYLDTEGKAHLPESEVGPGWFATGDVGYLDGDGYLFIVGRKKRMAKVGGELVPLGAVEALAEHLSPHHLHAALAFPAKTRGEDIVLVTTDPNLTVAILRKAAAEKGMAAMAAPRRVLVVPSMPRLGTGKVDYLRLTASLSESQASPPS